MAKRIRGLSRERLSHTVDLKKICRCKEAEDGEHECPAFDYLQERTRRRQHRQIQPEGRERL